MKRTNIEKAIEMLEAERKVIDLAIAKLRATAEKKQARPKPVLAKAE
jgi:hypothetical protein